MSLLISAHSTVDGGRFHKVNPAVKIVPDGILNVTEVETYEDIVAFVKNNQSARSFGIYTRGESKMPDELKTDEEIKYSSTWDVAYVRLDSNMKRLS